MRILNISSIIPLEGLKRENDILLRIQDYLAKKYSYEFTIAKSLPYTPSFLTNINERWKKYRLYQKSININVQGYNTIIYPWVMPPSSNFWVNYLLIPFNYLIYKNNVRNKLYNYAKESDLLLAQNLIPDAIVTYWLSTELNKPFILNLRGLQNEFWFKLPLLNKIIAKAEFLITPSPTIYTKYKDDYQIKLIPHPVEEKFFSLDKKDYSIPKLISVCRLLDWKNLDLVIKALAKLRDDDYSFEYKIVGDGPELDRLKSMVQNYELTKEVLFEGFVSYDLIPIYLKEANIYIQPSYPETLGRSFLEAAASGCLVVGHEQTGVDGILINNVSGLFVNKNNIYDYLKRVFEMVKNPSFAKMTHNSLSKINDLTWEKLGQEYHTSYQGVRRSLD